MATPHKRRMPAKERRSGNKSISDKMVPSFQYPCEGRSFLEVQVLVDNSHFSRGAVTAAKRVR
jgi:hypothetical protein